MFDQTRSLVRAVLVLGVGVWGTAATWAQTTREPLPLEVITSLQSNHPRSPVDLSPDGEWLAHTYGRAETVPRQTIWFAASGFPFAEGNARMQAALTNTKTGQVIRLGGYYERGQGRMGGTPWQYPDRYRENSPFFLFDRIETPLLIAQGEKDGRAFVLHFRSSSTAWNGFTCIPSIQSFFRGGQATNCC